MDISPKGKDLVYGTVMESFPNALFKVKIDVEDEVSESNEGDNWLVV
jgi:translation initiation factor IF-1